MQHIQRQSLAVSDTGMHVQAAQRVAAALKPALARAASAPAPLPVEAGKPDASAYIKQQSETLTAAMTQVSLSCMHLEA